MLAPRENGGATAIHDRWNINYDEIPTDFQENQGAPIGTEGVLEAMDEVMAYPEVTSFMKSIRLYDRAAAREGK